MMKAFISYSHKDSEAMKIVHYLEKTLPELNVEPITIIKATQIGDTWNVNITDTINNCSIFICFIRKKDPELMFELGYALAMNKKIILIGDYQQMPMELRSYPYIQRETYPYEILRLVEEYLSIEEKSIDSWVLDPHNPKETIKTLLDRPELLEILSHSEFTDIVKEWFSERGYNVTQTSKHRDYGYDLLVDPFNRDRAIVEVKKSKSNSKVPLTVIRNLVGAMAIEKITNGIIISTAPFTKSAFYFVKDFKQNIFLWTLNDFTKLDLISNENLEHGL